MKCKCCGGETQGIEVDGMWMHFTCAVSHFRELYKESNRIASEARIEAVRLRRERNDALAALERAYAEPVPIGHVSACCVRNFRSTN